MPSSIYAFKLSLNIYSAHTTNENFKSSATAATAARTIIKCKKRVHACVCKAKNLFHSVHHLLVSISFSLLFQCSFSLPLARSRRKIFKTPQEYGMDFLLAYWCNVERMCFISLAFATGHLLIQCVSIWFLLWLLCTTSDLRLNHRFFHSLSLLAYVWFILSAICHCRCGQFFEDRDHTQIQNCQPYIPKVCKINFIWFAGKMVATF